MKRLLALFILCAAASFGQNFGAIAGGVYRAAWSAEYSPTYVVSSFGTMPIFTSVQPETHYAIVVSGKDGKKAMTIEYNGQVSFGDSFTPTEATKVFVEELRKMGVTWGCKP